MNKILLMAGLLLGSFTAYANGTLSGNDTHLLAQYNTREQVVTAYYVSGGQLVRIKIKIENGSVTFYSTGKDAIGRENWVAVVPRGSITKTHSTFEGRLAREFDYKSMIYVQAGYQNQSLTIYF